jgi:hypothetical protein
MFLILFLFIASAVSLPFTCTFDKYSQIGDTSCNGLSYTATNQARISSFDVDPLVGTTKIVTDFTSIGTFAYL